jgi:acetyl-CoA decarbonylase/synthase complex subunit delta
MMGIGKYYIISPKFISADGGFKRLVWLSKNLKETMADELQAAAEREGIPDLVDRIADGSIVTEVDELVDFLKEKDHPALQMSPMEPAPEPEMAEVAAAEAAAPAARAAPAPPPPPTRVEPEAAAPAAPKPEPEPKPEAPTAPAPVMPAGVEVGDQSLAAVAQMSANLVMDQIRSALTAALAQLGGQVPAVPAAPAPAAPAAAPAEAAQEPVPPKKVRPQPVGAPWLKGEGESVELVHENWTGQVLELTLGATAAEGGTRTSTLTLGGETTLPYMFTEGTMPHPPALAIEIVDKKPTDWSPLLAEAWGDVMDDPAQWAVAAEKAGAKAILLRLSATKADDTPNTAEHVRATVKKVLQATGLPLIVYGPGQTELDNEFLVAAAEEGKGERLVLGLCEEKNYRTIVASALANDQLVISSTAMDVNLAKQLNILISDMGLPLERILMDPTCAAVGYGLEYGYSVMERLRLAALTGDKMTQLPMIVAVGNEAWRQKESRVGADVPEAWGDWKERALNWETLTAAALVESAANLIVLRHPESVRRVQAMIDELVNGAAAG